MLYISSVIFFISLLRFSYITMYNHDGNRWFIHVHIATLTKSHLAINACLAPVASMHGLAVTTVEGIGSTKTQLHPVQKRIAEAHGSQCGFCTPGIVMSMYTLLRNLPKPTMKDMEIAFQGNLISCLISHFNSSTSSLWLFSVQD
jgi:hypothetical protein